MEMRGSEKKEPRQLPGAPSQGFLSLRSSGYKWPMLLVGRGTDRDHQLLPLLSRLTTNSLRGASPWQNSRPTPSTHSQSLLMLTCTHLSSYDGPMCPGIGVELELRQAGSHVGGRGVCSFFLSGSCWAWQHWFQDQRLRPTI